MSLNVVHLVGRAGRDPEIKYFSDTGNALCELSLAVNRPTSRDDQPDWFNLKIWGRTAENAANFIKKGRLIGIQGALRIETWTDSNFGVTRSKPVIIVSRWELLDSKRDAPADMGNYDDGDGY
ncbi:MAG: single-stranded DNA-binding protein [Cyanobacteriota bacterium]|nr:single-stranded DNA-binding protein [Cyanobacteriota bacterium]